MAGMLLPISSTYEAISYQLSAVRMKIYLTALPFLRAASAFLRANSYFLGKLLQKKRIFK
jgi:hypothetical protein